MNYFKILDSYVVLKNLYKVLIYKYANYLIQIHKIIKYQLNNLPIFLLQFKNPFKLYFKLFIKFKNKKLS
jgi:hypothetical protein